MGGLQAHYLLEVLRHAELIVAERRRLVGRYREALGAAGIRARLHGPPRRVVENGYLFVLECTQAAEPLVAEFSSRGVRVARTYPETMDQQAPARGRYAAVSELRRSRTLVANVLNLPVFFGMTDEQLEVVIGIACEVLDSRARL